MKNIKKTALLLIIIFTYSCTKNTDQQHHINKKERFSDPTVNNTVSENKSENKNPDFPITEGRVSDIIPKKFEIQYETEGDINGDGLPDNVIVLRQKSDTLSSRTVIVLLKNKDHSFRLDKISPNLLPAEYNEAGYKKYDPEDISIEKGILSVNLYNPAPYGNLFFNFKYLNRDLVLTYIETYNAGAGSHQSLYYEPLKGKFIQEVTNTMEEEMPSETKSFRIKKQKFLFENSSPEDIISKVYSENDVYN